MYLTHFSVSCLSFVYCDKNNCGNNNTVTVYIENQLYLCRKPSLSAVGLAALMWSVIRKLQGVPLDDDSDTSAESRIERNQQSIMMHEMKPHPRPLDPDIFTRAYGLLEYEKTRTWMLSEEFNKRVQAIDHLIELYTQQRENAVRSLRYGFLELLLSTLHNDEEETMRCKAAEALAMLLMEPLAVDMLLAMDDEKFTLRELLATLSDPSHEVVILSLRLILPCRMAFNSYEAIARLVKYNFIERGIALLRHPEDRVVATACTALVTIFSVKEAFIPFIRLGGMSELTVALHRDDPFVISEAADVVTHAASYRMGKKAAVDCRTLVALMPHMLHQNLRVRTAVTGAVAQLTIYEPGKYQAVDEGLPPLLLALLMEEEERDVLVNVVKGIINVAEHPVGRKRLLGAKERLQSLSSVADDYQPLTSSICEALSQLERKC
ncbi:hypothetical protein, conserved [Trypanosoma brucei brucei TREU927]|uniref:Uncharacterized protein n=2 Tax=Trypanosoma brucei brucei (strain 927/4 GUTat10.1) TaxID=185431 RepID=Q385G1_TRYB2|nr:hypothetical protein, conserved [Trypanosoma brucei brucei TREU927]EAN79570.1 hypothetical protein, conserved [Trypanosoma brucei brucei TREU927]